MGPTRWSRRPGPRPAPAPMNDPRATRRVRAGPRRGDERGGAISLWVVLMVPVSAFAAVVAMAGPQRLAAESTMQESADDLADFAVAWRTGHNTPEGKMWAFPPECKARNDQQVEDLAALKVAIVELAALDPADPTIAARLTTLDDELDEQLKMFGMAEPPLPDGDEGELQTRFEHLEERLDAWEEACEVLFSALVRDLGYLGVDVGSLRGFYSDSLTESPMMASCSDPDHTTQTACVTASAIWTPAQPGFDLPCSTSAETSDRGAVVVRDGVHVALAARWQDAGWAAAQVWRDGLPMAAESIGRMSQRDAVGATALGDCGEQLVVLDSQGRPMWANGDSTPTSRELVQSVGRTPLSG